MIRRYRSQSTILCFAICALVLLVKLRWDALSYGSVKESRRPIDLIAGFPVCQPLRIEKDVILGAFCVIRAKDRDEKNIHATISILTSESIESISNLEAGYLWVGTSGTPRTFNDFPHQLRAEEQQNSFRFEDLGPLCTEHSGSFTAKATAVVNHDGKRTTAQATIELQCKEQDAVQERVDEIPGQSASQLRMKNDNRLLENSTIDRDHWIFHTEPSNDWLNAGRNPQCTSEAQNSIRNPSTILNEEFLRKAYISEYLSGTVCYDGGLLNNLPKYQDLYEHFMAWDDGVDDVTVMAKIEGMCYVAFRGTSYFNINDLVFQNLNPTVANVGDTNCYIRKGYYDAYYTPYVNDFERRMQLCLNSCKGGTCPLVITGGSQGAGPAVVASIVYRHLDPTVITWGGVRALYRISPIDASVCQDVNPQNHYRFVITDSTLRLIDFIPYQWAFFSQQIGHEILFDGNDMNYMGINNPVKRNPLTYSLLVHSPCNYDAKTRQLYENSCFPVPASGWKDGHWCKTDEDCESAFCTDLGFCNAGFDAGERCRRDEQCVSKTCIQSVSECAPYHGKMNEGMHCRDDEDCASGRCEQGLFGWLPLVDSVCAPQLDTGEECNEDSDCKSNVCGGFLLWGRRCWPQD